MDFFRLKYVAGETTQIPVNTLLHRLCVGWLKTFATLTFSASEETRAGLEVGNAHGLLTSSLQHPLEIMPVHCANIIIFCVY